MNFNTDLALERRDIYKKANNLEDEIPGIETTEEDYGKNIKITRVKITNKDGETALGKPIGTYVTIDIKNLKIATEDEIEKAAMSVNKELQKIINEHVNVNEDILVVGLGNREITPDSLRTKSSTRY